MGEGTKAYTFAAVQVLFGGVSLNGFGEGGGVEITVPNDVFTYVEGVDGSTLRSYSGSKMAEAKVTLMQSSFSNTFLAALHASDVESADAGEGGVGVLPFQVVDTSGLYLAHSAKAWIVKPPDSGYSNKNMDRVWTFHLSKARVYVAGNI